MAEKRTRKANETIPLVTIPPIGTRWVRVMRLWPDSDAELTIHVNAKGRIAIGGNAALAAERAADNQIILTQTPYPEGEAPAAVVFDTE